MDDCNYLDWGDYTKDLTGKEHDHKQNYFVAINEQLLHHVLYAHKLQGYPLVHLQSS